MIITIRFINPDTTPALFEFLEVSIYHGISNLSLTGTGNVVTLF